MSIEINQAMKNIGNFAFGSPILNTLIGNVAVVAILIVFVMLMIIMVFYPAKKGTGLWILGKMSIYMFLITGMLLFLHDVVVDKKREISEDDDNLLHDIVYGKGERQEIRPNLGKSESSHTPVPAPAPTPPPVKVETNPYNGSIINGGGGVLYGSKPPKKMGEAFR